MGRDGVDGGRRSVIGMLGVALAAGAAGALPFKALAGPGAAGWPLWRVRRAGKAFYLTAETPPQAVAWHDAHVEHVLASCPVLWTETNSITRLGMPALIQRYGVDAKRPLAARLAADDARRLADAAALCKVDMADLAAYRPWFVGAMLQEAFYQASGWRGASAKDVLASQAAKAGLPVRSEFAVKDDVFAWFDALTPQQEIQFLRYALDEVLAGADAGGRIYGDWAAGRPERAAAEVARYGQAYPELAEKLTFERNRQWLPRFEAMLAGPGTPMVVVGLYHMVGPSGLLALCRGDGMVVERV